jgi:hypothetical protein
MQEFDKGRDKGPWRAAKQQRSMKDETKSGLGDPLGTKEPGRGVAS